MRSCYCYSWYNNALCCKYFSIGEKLKTWERLESYLLRAPNVDRQKCQTVTYQCYLRSNNCGHWRNPSIKITLIRSTRNDNNPTLFFTGILLCFIFFNALWFICFMIAENALSKEIHQNIMCTIERSWVASEIEVNRLVFPFQSHRSQAHLVKERNSEKYLPE